MMRLIVSNIGGITEYEAEIKPGKTLVTGKNSSGKTCLQRALAACLSHDANPRHLSAAARSLYVTKGESTGAASLEVDGDEVVWSPKEGISAQPESKPRASREAVGLVDFLKPSSGPKERAKVWEKLFLSGKPMELLEPVWPSNLSKGELGKIVEIIELTEDGWKRALKYYEELRTQEKRIWESVAGTRYGVDKAAKWKPANWSADLEGQSLEALEEKLSDARTRLRGVLIQEAVSEAEILKARHRRETELPALEESVKGIKAKLRPLQESMYDMETQKSEIEKQRLSLQKGVDRLSTRINDNDPPYNCPECGAGLYFDHVADHLMPFKKMSDEERQELRNKREETNVKISEINVEYKARADAVVILDNKTNALLKEVATKTAEIRVLKRDTKLFDAKPNEGTNEVERKRLENEVETAKEGIRAFKDNLKAQKCVGNIVQYDAICAILGPKGVRSTKIQEGLAAVRKILATINSATGWLALDIDRNFEVTSDGVSALTLSKNETLKAAWALQIAVALLLGSKWVLLDDADTLKDESWDGLVNLIDRVAAKYTDLNILVFATSTETPSGWNRMEMKR